MLHRNKKFKASKTAIHNILMPTCGGARLSLRRSAMPEPPSRPSAPRPRWSRAKTTSRSRQRGKDCATRSCTAVVERSPRESRARSRVASRTTRQAGLASERPVRAATPRQHSSATIGRDSLDSRASVLDRDRNPVAVAEQPVKRAVENAQDHRRASRRRRGEMDGEAGGGAEGRPQAGDERRRERSGRRQDQRVQRAEVDAVVLEFQGLEVDRPPAPARSTCARSERLAPSRWSRLTSGSTKARPKLLTGAINRAPRPPAPTNSRTTPPASRPEAVSGPQLSAASVNGRHSRSIAASLRGPRLATVAAAGAQRRRRADQ